MDRECPVHTVHFSTYAKAFDVVDHKVRLQKLAAYNLIPHLKAGYGHILRTENSVS